MADRFSEEGELERFFTYQRPSHVTIPKFEKLNAAFLACAQVVRDELPPGPDRESAIRSLQRARMDANLAVATHKPWSAEEIEKPLQNTGEEV